MKILFHKIASIFLTMILLFSTTVYSVNQHVCCDSIYSVSLIGHAEDCGMEIENCEKNNKDISTISKEKCCSDVNIVVEKEVFNKINQITINTNIVFLTTYIITSQNLYESFSNQVKDCTNYYPPLINKDITILYEVFLI